MASKTQTSGKSTILSSLKGKAPKTAEATEAEVVAEKVVVKAETVEVVAESAEVQEEQATEVANASDASPVGETAEVGSADSGTADMAPGGDFSWDNLPAAEIVVYSRAVVKADLEATTPTFIKDRVNSAFKATQEAGLDDKGQPKPVYFIQNCGTPERADEFLKLARKYSAFVDRTLRGEANPAKVKTAQGFVSGAGMVSFAVKPKETRTRHAK